MIGQNGKSSTLNALAALGAILGTKVVDAVGDIRAHPTGDMGSIGLAGSPKPMIQTAVGGNRAENRYIELVVRGATAKVSPILRTAADSPAASSPPAAIRCAPTMCKKHAALGGISLALKLGEAIIAAERQGRLARSSTPSSRPPAARSSTKGTVTDKDVVYTKEAFDIGTITLGEGDKATTLHVMNEYMAIDDAGGTRLATFPDVITTLDAAGQPLSASASCGEGMYVFVLHVPKTIIPLRPRCSIRRSIRRSRRQWASSWRSMRWPGRAERRA